MPNKIVTFVGNADEKDATASIYVGTDGSGKPIFLRAGKSLELTEAQIRAINGRHILVEGNEEPSIVIRDSNTSSDFRARLRGKTVSPIAH